MYYKKLNISLVLQINHKNTYILNTLQTSIFFIYYNYSYTQRNTLQTNIYFNKCNFLYITNKYMF